MSRTTLCLITHVKPNLNKNAANTPAQIYNQHRICLLSSSFKQGWLDMIRARLCTKRPGPRIYRTKHSRQSTKHEMTDTTCQNVVEMPIDCDFQKVGVRSPPFQRVLLNGLPELRLPQPDARTVGFMYAERKFLTRVDTQKVACSSNCGIWERRDEPVPTYSVRASAWQIITLTLYSV